MNRPKPSSSSAVVVYHGETCLGELEVLPVKPQPQQQQQEEANQQQLLSLLLLFPNNEIRIHHMAPLSERCPPLSVLQSISSSVRCKLESSLPSDHQPHLLSLHASCFYELKTAVVLVGDEEIHLVAMPSKQKKFPCFWCYTVPSNLYNSCLGMLNMRCLAIVFDLDETLIVANTMKSFEDRIEALKGWIAREMDPVRASGMSAELKRYMDDRALLKQYTDGDCVVDGNKVFKVQLEEVVPLSDNHEGMVRPVIRLPEKNIVLTRINPENRDTSVLVRLRPAWEDLRGYLMAKGRKRFEVFVCTMAERDYALEMWRLLDPGAHLIDFKQLLNRVVCVKSGSRKSLLNVFRDGLCHPNMAMVIDDRLKVWEEKDQPRVHVVPAFTPYYAPQAETASAVPVLCVARNVACNVRGGFFKEFDENLLRKISELFYEDDVSILPFPPDVSNYLISEETGFVPNPYTHMPMVDGISGAEVEQRLQQADEKTSIDSDSNPGTYSLKPEPSLLAVPSVSNVTNSVETTLPSQKGLLGIPARRDIRNPSGDPPILKLPGQTPQAGWLVDDDVNKGGFARPRASDLSKSDNSHSYQGLLGHPTASLASGSYVGKGRNEEASRGLEWQKSSLPPNEVAGRVSGVAGGGSLQNSAATLNKETQADPLKTNAPPSSLSISVLQEIGRRCSSKVEFKPILSTSKDLQFSVEVLFTGEKIGVGMGKTRKDAQQQAAENALRCLADKYLAYVTVYSGIMDRDPDKASIQAESGILWDDVIPQSNDLSSDEKPKKEVPLENGVFEIALQGSDVAPGSASLMVTNQQSRPVQPLSNKRPKEESVRGLQSSTSVSLRQQRL